MTDTDRSTRGAAAGVDLVALRAALDLCEEGLQGAVAGMADPFVVCTAVRDAGGSIVDFTVEYLNRAAIDMFDLRPAVVGGPLSALLDEPGVFEAYVSVVETGRPASIERLVSPSVNGVVSDRVFEVHATRVGDGIAAAWRDVTDRVLAEETARSAEQRLRTVLGGAPVIVVAFDASGRCAFIDGRGLRTAGIDGERLVGRDVRGLLPDPRVAGAVDRALGGEEVVLDAHFAERAWELRLAPFVRDERVAGGVCVCLDVTDRVRVEAERAASEARWRALVQHSSDIVLAIDATGTITYASPAARPMLGVDPATAVATSVFDYLHPDDIDRALQAFADGVALEGAQPRQQWRVRAASGGWRDLEVAVNNLLHDPAVGAIVVNARDVTERARAERIVFGQRHVLELIARGAPLATSLTAIAGEIEEHVGGGRAAVVLDETAGVSASSMSAGDRELVAQLVAAGGRWATEAARRALVVADVDDPALPMEPAERDLLRAGGVRAVWSTPVRTYGGDHPLGLIVLFRDEPGAPDDDHLGLLHGIAQTAAIAIEREAAERLLSYRALHDPLTDLPNRALFVDRLHHALADRRGAKRTAVLFVDLDHFKVVNDSLGHHAGDELLVEVAHRLSGAVRAHDTVARFGGDEFAVLFEVVGEVAEVAEVADRLLAALRPPIVIAGHEAHVTASVGIAVSEPGRGDDPATLLRDADAAMYRAKERGRDRAEMFDTGLRERVVARLTLETELRHALDNGQIVPHYQPEVRLGGGWLGAEALARWVHPERGVVMPGAFIEVAEEAGLIGRLGLAMLEAACADAAGWPSVAGAPPLMVSVNVSAVQLADASFPHDVERVLATTGLDPSALCLEVTESVIMGDPDAALAVLERLKALGVSLAIDDFGTGYSSLAYLKRLPVDFVKVDRSFVDGLGSVAEDDAIVSAVVALAHRLDLQVIAEGVERPAQRDLLRGLGCDAAQGWLWSKAVPAREVASIFAAASPAATRPADRAMAGAGARARAR